MEREEEGDVSECSEGEGGDVSESSYVEGGGR